MIQSCYATLFHPQEARPLLSAGIAGIVLFFVGLVLALTQSAGSGPFMLLLVAFLFWGILLVQWLFLSGALLLANRLMGGISPEKKILAAVGESFWPFLLLAPAAAFGQTFPSLGAFFGVLAWVWFFLALVGALKSLESWGWMKSLGAVLFSGGLLFLSLFLVFFFPLAIAFLILS
ncbi:MAG TPA: hypothetical protein V6C82_10265 [Chroococcales cyanobacterium]|jgi:hypothetical protein